MPTSFIPITPATLDSALDLMKLLYTEPGGTHDRQAASRAAEHLFHNPESGGLWFIESDGRTAGYLALTACFSLEFGSGFGLLDELYLLPQWRGKGLGAEALAFAQVWCRSRGYSALRLEVDLSNERALRLYRGAGFLSHGRDLMTKWL